MKKALLLAIIAALYGCNASPEDFEKAKAQGLGGTSMRYEAFEVPEFGLVCVGSTRGISCVKK